MAALASTGNLVDVLVVVFELAADRSNKPHREWKEQAELWFDRLTKKVWWRIGNRLLPQQELPDGRLGVHDADPDELRVSDC